MRSSEINIRRREMMSSKSVAALLRRMADQLEAEHAFRLEERPIALANVVEVVQEFQKEGLEHTYTLMLMWDEELADQPKLGGDPEAEADQDPDELPEHGVPTPPLDLPGPDDRYRVK